MYFTKFYTIVIIFVSIIWIGYASEEFKIIHTENGALRGKQQFTLFDNTPYYSFLGIPYGKPPVNDLRFKPPQKSERWYGTRDALDYGRSCVQVRSESNQLIGNEDCLYLNVYTPGRFSSTKKAVIVFIYGGTFTDGLSSCFGPDFLIDNDVIVVTFDFRLGAFGFLSLGTDDYSGNNGLKDQLLALKWVQSNIEHFGGDKESVTLYGQSSGSSCASLHTFSSESRGLFRRAILQSGTGLVDWAYNLENNQTQMLYQFANQYGHIYPDNNIDLMNYFRNVDAYFLVNKTYKSAYNPLEAIQTFKINFAPVLESKNADQPFLIKAPIDYLTKHSNQDLDMLIAFNSNEGLAFLSAQIEHPELLDLVNNNFKVNLPLNFLKFSYYSEEFTNMMQDVRQFYFGNEQVNITTFQNFTNMLSDVFLVYAVHTTALLEKQTQFGNIYLLENTMDTKLNIFKILSGANALGLPGATHGDDLYYIFRATCSLYGEPYNNPYKNITKNSLEYNLIRSTAELWANFVKYGKPIIKSDGFLFDDIRSVRKINYGLLTNSGPVAGVDPFKDRMDFWNDFLVKYKTDLE